MNARTPLITFFLTLGAAAQAQLPQTTGPGYASVRDAPYFAAGDGKTDDTRAIQRALDDVAAAGGGITFVPTGSYLVARHLRVPGGVALVGVGRAPRA